MLLFVMFKQASWLTHLRVTFTVILKARHLQDTVPRAVLQPSSLYAHTLDFGRIPKTDVLIFSNSKYIS